MNIIKKIAVILPLVAVGLFIYTLNFIDKKQNSPAGVVIESFVSSTTSTPDTQAIIMDTKEKITKKTVTTITETEVFETTTSSCQVTTVYDGIVTKVVTPFSKTPQVEPLQEIQQSTVITPSEIVIESIPLICPETTSDTDEILAESPEYKGDVPFVTTAPDLTTTTDIISDTTAETTTTVYTESDQNASSDNTEISESTDMTTTTTMVSQTTATEDILLNQE